MENCKPVPSAERGWGPCPALRQLNCLFISFQRQVIHSDAASHFPRTHLEPFRARFLWDDCLWATDFPPVGMRADWVFLSNELSGERWEASSSGCPRKDRHIDFWPKQRRIRSQGMYLKKATLSSFSGPPGIISQWFQGKPETLQTVGTFEKLASGKWLQFLFCCLLCFPSLSFVLTQHLTV